MIVFRESIGPLAICLANVQAVERSLRCDQFLFRRIWALFLARCIAGCSSPGGRWFPECFLSNTNKRRRLSLKSEKSVTSPTQFGIVRGKIHTLAGDSAPLSPLQGQLRGSPSLTLHPTLRRLPDLCCVCSPGCLLLTFWAF